MTTLPGLIVNLTLAHAQFTQGLHQVNQQLGVLNKSVNIAKNALTGFLAGFGVQQLVALGRGAIDAAGGMAELAQRAGVTGKQLQILQLAGVQAGVSQDQLVTALSQLNVRLSRAEEGTGNLRTMLQRYNITTQDAHGNTRATADVLADFADVIQNTASQTERGGIAAELFGARIGAKFLPLLSKGSEGLRDFGRQIEQAGLLLGDDFLADADAASDALAALQLALQRGFQIGVIGEFRDSVSSSIDAMREAKEAGEAMGQIVGAALRLIAATAETLVPLFQQLASEIDTISNAAKMLGDLAERFTGDAVAVELLNEDIGSLNEQIAELIGRRRELESTGVGSERATAEINDQIEVFKRQREELIETRNQLQFVDTAEKNLGDTLSGTTAELDKQARVLPGLAAQLQRTHGELIKLAAIDMADLQVELDPNKRVKAEVEFSLKKHKEEGDNIVRITEEWTHRANQVRHQANEEAARDAKQAAERIAREAEQAAEEQRRFDEQKTQEHYERLGQIAEDTIKRGNQARFQATKDAAREQERLAEQASDEQQRQAERAAQIQMEPFLEATRSIQGAFTNAYENIFSGGVDSFSELADEIKRIFIRLAAEIATLMTIQPLLSPLTGGAAGFGGMFGGAAGAGSLAAGTLMTPGGVPIPSVAPGAPFPVAPAGPGLLGPGLLGGLGGALLAPMLFGGGLGTSVGGGIGGAGGAIGGALLGSMFPGVGTVLGAVGGGLLGGLGGGFLGSLFGGGGPSGNEVSIGGGFGRAGAGGTGAAAKFVVQFDKQMSELLNDRQLELADQALREAKSVSVKYEKELSEGDMARLAEGRVAPVAGALGFRKAAFKGLGAEEGLAQLQEALQLEKTIEDLTGAVTPFKRSILDLREQFAAAESRAKELGISTSGMGKALREAEQQLRDQRNLERGSLKLQLQAIIGSGSASRELAVAIAGIRLQFQGLRREAEALGVPLELVRQAEKAAIQQAREAAAQLREQRQFERAGLRLQLQAIIGTGSASRELAVAIANIRLQFHGLREQAEELGVSLKLVKQAERAAIQQAKDASREAKRQRAADKEAAKAFLQDFRTTDDYQRQLNAIEQSYQQAIALAREYNLSEKGLRDAKRESIRALKEQQQAEIDALALSVINPFEALADPLRNFTQELERSLLSPIELFRVAQEDFRETARRAQAGDIEAIEQLDEAGKFFIEQAGRFGASPAQVQATHEVLRATQGITTQVDISMREASRGISDEIRRASNRQDDTLKELVDTSKDIVKEIKKLRT